MPKKRDAEIDRLLGSPTHGVARSYRDLGPLHELLIEACPPNQKGVRSIPVLAKALGLSAWAVFKWIKRNEIPPRQAKRVVDLSKGRVKLDQFSPFIFG
jgi:hypothetical protein